MICVIPCKPFKNDEKCFLFDFKSSFHSQEFRFLSWLFGHVEKLAQLEIHGQFQNLWSHKVVN